MSRRHSASPKTWSSPKPSFNRLSWVPKPDANGDDPHHRGKSCDHPCEDAPSGEHHPDASDEDRQHADVAHPTARPAQYRQPGSRMVDRAGSSNALHCDSFDSKGSEERNRAENVEVNEYEIRIHFGSSTKATEVSASAFNVGARLFSVITHWCH